MDGAPASQAFDPARLPEKEDQHQEGRRIQRGCRHRGSRWQVGQRGTCGHCPRRKMKRSSGPGKSRSFRWRWRGLGGCCGGDGEKRQVLKR
ncbi:hypothetical protein HPP92_006811 [Vanilla planifolia]|uniref:Uncharacterized protein n=1 Tax=Vanilla planifolia TaxID=51239 RepID=A0A835RPL0_VANPL|nr:hypothetical protein HPP92_006811 [Vanilla planifolia]